MKEAALVGNVCPVIRGVEADSVRSGGGGLDKARAPEDLEWRAGSYRSRRGGTVAHFSLDSVAGKITAVKARYFATFRDFEV